MFSKKKREGSSIATLIGAGTTVTGDLAFRDGLHLDGRVVGDVTGEAGGAALTIGTGGVVEGAVTVDELVLNGTVRGDVTVRERVELGATAQVDGNLTYGVLEMAAGAKVNGRLIHQRGKGASPAENSPGEDVRQGGGGDGMPGPAVD
jgi:cytoskeletal protein CcmA (bactofilin family)